MRLKHNSGKSVCISPGNFKLPNVPLVDQQIDFIQLSLSYGHKHVLVMDCIFSLWIESFPCRQVTATSVAVCVCVCVCVCTQLLDSLQLHGMSPTSLLCPWDFPGNGYEFEQTQGDSKVQGNLECCNSWGPRELDMTW